MGTVSELLIVRLLKSAGDYLEDPNVMHNYSNKRSLPAKQSYAIEVVRKGYEKLNSPTPLPDQDGFTFREFYNIVDHLFDSMRLRRNEYVHPKPDLTLAELPTLDVVRANIQGFNPYARIILKIIQIFGRTTGT